MRGHQAKGTEKNKLRRRATINAADAACRELHIQNIKTPHKGRRQDRRSKLLKRHTDAYARRLFQAGKQAKAQYVIPEKTQKGKKAAGDTDPVKSPDDKEKKIR